MQHYLEYCTTKFKQIKSRKYLLHIIYFENCIKIYDIFMQRFFMFMLSNLTNAKKDDSKTKPFVDLTFDIFSGLDQSRRIVLGTRVHYGAVSGVRDHLNWYVSIILTQVIPQI